MATIKGEQKEKLILALLMEELVGKINLVMRVRKLNFILDYTEDHSPRLYVDAPGIPRELCMKLDTRKHICYTIPPKNHQLFFGLRDIEDRLKSEGAKLILTGDKPPNGPKRAILQIHIADARTIAITILDTTKGKKNWESQFQLPNGITS